MPHNCVRGEDHYESKLTMEQVREIKERLAAGEGQTEIAADYPVSHKAIDHIKAGRSWTHV